MKKTVIVTGAASGIGLAWGKILLSRGARVTAVDPQFQRMRENLDPGPNLTLLEGDISSDSDCSATVTETEKSFGKIDGLIHLGEAHSSARWDELEAEKMNRILAINVTGSFQISRAVAKHMKEQGSGSIVLTTSASVMFGVTGGNGQGGPAYVSTKGAVPALMRSLARSLGPQRHSRKCGEPRYNRYTNGRRLLRTAKGFNDAEVSPG